MHPGLRSSRRTPTARRGASTGKASASSARSGASSTAGGPRNPCTAATSISCSTRASTPSSTTTTTRAHGSAGAPRPEELAARAAELGYEALALTDHDGVYGSLEFAHAAKHFGVRPITGAEVTLRGNAHVTLLCETQQGYANLCRILTDAHAG